jgi:hypothetical protein
VSHAEKDLTLKNDPLLTPEGTVCAKNIRDYFLKILMPFTQLHITETKHLHYLQQNQLFNQEFLKKLVGHTVLIVEHNNTIP